MKDVREGRWAHKEQEHRVKKKKSCKLPKTANVPFLEILFSKETFVISNVHTQHSSTSTKKST